MCFLVLSISQLFHSFNIHSRKSVFRSNLFGNPYLLLSFIICLGLQLSVVIVPFLSNLFASAALGWTEWLVDSFFQVQW
jgi:Ca2+-transporting ATPase